MNERFLQTHNEDYIKGIKFLLEKTKEEGINIRQYEWIPRISELLSKHNLCYKFWYNTWEQNKLKNIPKCETWHDIMYGANLLFYWGTEYSLWSNTLNKIALGVNSYDTFTHTLEMYEQLKHNKL